MPFTMRRNHQTSNEVWRRHAFPCAYDAVNQLVTSTDADGKVTEYAYDAVGRMVKEGTKTYRYGYLDKVLAVTEGKARYIYGYHVDGQLASATKTMSGKAGGAQSPATEVFYWDGLALVKRGITSYVNEPHPGGGAAVFSSKDGVMFNDILGTTLGTQSEHGYASVAMTAFGDTADADALFTGKPLVDGLGHAFLLRNYRAGLGKWLTADPLGYPDGWNQLAYGNNAVLSGVDRMGGTFWEAVLDFGIAFNEFVDTLMKWKVISGTEVDQDRTKGGKKSVGYDVEIRLNVTWSAVTSILNRVVNVAYEDGGPVWFNDNASHVMGLSSHNDTYNQFEAWLSLSDRNPFLNFVEDHIPNMHTTSMIHDAWVEYLIDHGAPMSAINVPTMIPAYMTALMVNLYTSGESLVELVRRCFSE